MPGVTQNESITLLKEIVAWLYEDDPEFVEGGCADVSSLLHKFCEKRGISASIVTGDAIFSKTARYPHVWLIVEEATYDPVYSFFNQRPRCYEVKPYDLEGHFGVMSEDEDWRLHEVLCRFSAVTK